jgi:tetratricopeptide (TPR) repeat protein
MSISDRQNHLLQRLIEKASPSSMEELQALLDSLMGAPLPEIPENEQNDEDKALDLVEQAYASRPAVGKKLALQALERWPDCIAAFEYLGGSTRSVRLAFEYYEKGVKIGQRLFGGEFRQKHEGNFWLITPTRPYMRCLHNMALCYWEIGQTSQAISIWEDLIRLNPSDNQGVRYSLLPALLQQRDLPAYKKYRKKYDEESAQTFFNDALAEFLEKGITEYANMLLQAAVAHNRYVIPFLLQPARPDYSPTSYTIGSPEEAVIYAEMAWKLWMEAPGAQTWLKTIKVKKWQVNPR